MIKIFKNVDEFYNVGSVALGAGTKFVFFKFESAELTHQKLYITYNTAGNRLSNRFTK